MSNAKRFLKGREIRLVVWVVLWTQIGFASDAAHHKARQEEVNNLPMIKKLTSEIKAVQAQVSTLISKINQEQKLKRYPNPQKVEIARKRYQAIYKAYLKIGRYGGCIKGKVYINENTIQGKRIIASRNLEIHEITPYNATYMLEMAKQELHLTTHPPLSPGEALCYKIKAEQGKRLRTMVSRCFRLLHYFESLYLANKGVPNPEECSKWQGLIVNSIQEIDDVLDVIHKAKARDTLFLLTAMSDKRLIIKTFAAEELGLLRESEAVPSLLQMLQEETIANDVLLRRADPTHARWIKEQYNWQQYSRKQASSAALFALGKIGDPQAVNFLIKEYFHNKLKKGEIWAALISISGQEFFNIAEYQIWWNENRSAFIHDYLDKTEKRKTQSIKMKISNR